VSDKDMYERAYWDIQRILDEALGTREGDGAGAGIAADVRLVAEQRDILRAELRNKRSDLLHVRGILSPNGEAPKTPVSLVPDVAPAVAWLVAEVERLRALAGESDA
jgi:hypothetical protein